MPPPRHTSEQIERARIRRKQVGARVRELRIERGLTQEALALEAGLDRTMVIYVEWGRNGLAFDRLWCIADALGVDIVDLFVIPGEPARRRVHRGGRSRFASRRNETENPAAEQERGVVEG